MNTTWDANTPIYRQIKARITREILDGTLTEGSMLPSVRTISSDSQVNPITVSRAFQELADEGVVEKRRGLGMFIVEGARARLLEHEKSHFITHEWPGILARINLLRISPSTLFPFNGVSS
jgi:GntR family transcriptional regulator